VGDSATKPTAKRVGKKKYPLGEGKPKGGLNGEKANRCLFIFGNYAGKGVVEKYKKPAERREKGALRKKKKLNDREPGPDIFGGGAPF